MIKLKRFKKSLIKNLTLIWLIINSFKPFLKELMKQFKSKSSKLMKLMIKIMLLKKKNPKSSLKKNSCKQTPKNLSNKTILKYKQP